MATNLHTAAKQALEALEDTLPDDPYPFSLESKAITALRQALANEALDKMAENARELGLDYEPAYRAVKTFHGGKPWPVQEPPHMKTVIEMAREACDKDKVDAWHNGFWTVTQQELERFAELVRADAVEREREACARIAEEPSATTYECTVACGGPEQTFTQRMPKAAHEIAKEIRARSNT